jgi:hypothetical protein
LLGVGEEVMGTGSHKVRATDLGIGDGELSVARGITDTHELVGW